MRVLYFGTYDRAYPRNAQVISALRGAGVDVSEQHRSVWERRHNWSVGLRQLLRLAEAERSLGRSREDERNAEALIVGYEEALTRRDSITGDWYDCSAHMLWIGERTRELDGAHIEFLRGVGNPIGCKVGPTMSAEELLELCAILNPSRIPGRLTLITRMGADKIEESLRPLLRVVADAGHPVVWACDPMHGNTFTAPSGRKTRHFDDIVREISGLVRAHRAEGTWPGGIHVELTGENVTECLGGGDELLDSDLDSRYETVCDPRLNARQGVDLAFRVAELIQDFT